MSILVRRGFARFLRGWMAIMMMGSVGLNLEAAQFYIDFQGGNDANSGTSQATAWKTIPGTRNPANTSDVSTSWGGIFNSANHVPPGTVFKIKSGTICGTNVNLGQVLISPTYYSSAATFVNPILFQRDTSWGSGSVVFDGNGVALGSGTGWGLLHITVGGISFNGVAGVNDTYDGIIVRNSDRIGISYFANTLTEGGALSFVKFFACGKMYTSTNCVASEGHLFFKYHTNGIIANCEFDGNRNWHNGIAFTSDNQDFNFTVTNCVARNFTGSDSYQWVGIGFKAQNSVITWRDCTAYSNYKGWDPGENGGNTNLPISYTLINCASYSNQFGVNLNGPDAGVFWPAGVTFRLINCIIYQNAQIGSKIYAGPYNLYMVHNVYDSNDINLKVGPDGLDDLSKPINAYLYNNIFCNGNSMNLLGGAWGINPTAGTSYGVPVNFSLVSDFNSYIQKGSEYFFRWSYWNPEPNGATNVYDFSYGANGPGHTSGNWYAFIGADSTWHPTNGCTGHFHCDAHSKGTGAADPSLPPFEDSVAHNYILTNHYAGTNLSTMPWFIPEMGRDRNGRPRTSWDLGPYEFVDGVPNPPSGLHIVQTSAY